MGRGVMCILNSAHPKHGVLHCLSAIQEIEAIKARVKEMEEEAEKLKEMQTEVEKQMSTKSGEILSRIQPQPHFTLPTPLNCCLLLLSGTQYPTPEEKAEMDARSVYVGNVSVMECVV